jgi:N,N'-diacetylchitobiose transport system permease protein
MASAVSVFVLVLTIALSWFYVRSLLKEDES